MPVLPIESGTDAAEKVRAHLNTVVEIELLIVKRVILAQPGPVARMSVPQRCLRGACSASGHWHKPPGGTSFPGLVPGGLPHAAGAVQPCRSFHMD